MTKPSDLKSIEQKTGKKWEEWVTLLDSFNAKDMPHSEIVKKLEELTELDGWWRQNITVAYEQYIGRRIPGQREDGTFEVSVTKTLNGSMDSVFTGWINLVQKRSDFNNVKFEGEPKTSQTDKWRNWRVKLSDGTKVIVGINQKTADKAMLGLVHQKLAGTSEVEQWRDYWRELLASINN